MARVSETTPLLAAASENPVTQTDSEVLTIHKLGQSATTTATSEITQEASEDQAEVNEDEDQPLVMSQVIALCYARLVEPIAFFSIFPFINQMIAEVGGVREEDVGFYSGLIESLFSLTQMIFMISWGRAADRFGRKTVLVPSLIGVSIATCLFGFSKSIWQMILFRCIAGMFSGTIVTVRTMLSENSTQKTQARAFSWYAFTGNIGIFLGPVIGGALSSPATQYPGVFGNVAFFKENPYALPSLVSGLIGFSAVITSSIFLKETLHTKDSNKSKSEPPMSIWEILKQPGIGITLFIYALTMLQGIANTAVSPVFWYTSIPLGGYGFSPLQISAVLAFAGISQAIWLLFIFPWAQKRWGTGGVLRYCGFVFPISAITSPIGSILLRNGLFAAFWTVLPVSMAFGSGASMSFTCVQLALNNISPSPEVLGTLNALALAMTAGIRAVAPALFASLFATGVRSQILDGYLIWVVMEVVTLTMLVAIRYLPKKAGEDQRK